MVLTRSYLSADACTFVYMTRQDVDGIVDNHPNAIYSEIERRYLHWRQTATDINKGLISCDAMLSSDAQLDELHLYILNSLVADFMISRGKNVMIKPNLGYDYRDKNDIITSEKVGKFFNQDRIQNWNRQFTRQWRNFVTDCKGISFSELARIDAIRRDEARKIANKNKTRFVERYDAEKVIKKSDRQRGMRVMRRSSELFKHHLGEHNLKAFLSGNAFVVEGKEFNYRIRKSAHVDLLKQAAFPTTHHVPYNLELLDKENKFLGSVCVYFDGTPALDQIVAMVLHVRHDEERRLLAKANILRRGPYFSENTAVREIWPKQSTTPTAMHDFLNNLEPRDNLDEFNELQDALRPQAQEEMFKQLEPNRTALEFLMKPGIHFDEIHTLSGEAVEQRLLPLLEH